MLTIFKQIFIWWNQQTLGTRIYTFLNGKLVGKDEFGNKYYENKKKNKRWVIYQGEIDASKISNEWYLWIHFTNCLLYTSPSPRDKRQSRMPSSA